MPLQKHWGFSDEELSETGPVRPPIVPKLKRPEYDTEKSRHALIRFTLAVSHLQYRADGTTQPAEAAIGAGQHYGLATHLIDFTLDPLVATFFAVDS